MKEGLIEGRNLLDVPSFGQVAKWGMSEECDLDDGMRSPVLN